MSILNTAELTRLGAQTGLRESQGPIPVLAIGDSLTNANNDNSANVLGATAFVNQVCLRSSGKLFIRRTIGIPGNTSSDISYRLADEGMFHTVLGGMAIVLQGTNDLNQSISVNTLTLNDRLIIRLLRSHGLRVAMIAIPPSANYGPDSINYNTAKKAVANAEGAIWIDPWTDARASDGTYVANASTDGIHPIQAYTALAAQIFLNDSQIVGLLPAYATLAATISGDLTAPTLNGAFTSTYTSGSNLIPVNWTSLSSAGIQTTRDSNNIGVATITPTATAGTPGISNNNFNVSVLAGRRVAFSGKISTTGLASSGGTFTVRIQAGTSETNESFSITPLGDLNTDVTNGVFYFEGTLPAGITFITLLAFYTGITSIATSVVLSEVSIRATDHQGVDTRLRRVPARIRNLSAAATLTLDDEIVIVDATASAITITLPLAGKNTYGFGNYTSTYQKSIQSTGFPVTIIKIDSSTNAVTIVPQSTNTIEGSTSATLTSQYAKNRFTPIRNGLWMKQ